MWVAEWRNTETPVVRDRTVTIEKGHQTSKTADENVRELQGTESTQFGMGK